MIKGIGIDIIEIYRIEAAIIRNKKFFEKVFTEKERQLFNEKKFNISTIAGNFAAKEAVVKALGTGIGVIGWRDIEILRDSYGKPYVNLYNKAIKEAYSKDIEHIFISISHSRENVVAQAIAT